MRKIATCAVLGLSLSLIGLAARAEEPKAGDIQEITKMGGTRMFPITLPPDSNGGQPLRTRSLSLAYGSEAASAVKAAATVTNEGGLAAIRKGAGTEQRAETPVSREIATAARAKSDVLAAAAAETRTTRSGMGGNAREGLGPRGLLDQKLDVNTLKGVQPTPK